jgi:hypothetical protein
VACMTDRETLRAAQQAFADAEEAMDAIEGWLPDVVAVLGPEETAAWLSSVVSSIAQTEDCEGSA